MRNRRGFPLILLAAFALFLSTGTAWPVVPTEGMPRPQSPEALLQKHISCDFELTAFSDVAEYLRTVSGMNIVYDPMTDAEEPFITLSLRDLPLRQVLHWATTLADLEYQVIGRTAYIAPEKRMRQFGRAQFQQYEVNDLLVTMAALRSSGGSNGNNNNSGNSNRSGTRKAANELMTLVVLFTGGTSNWDHVEVMGYGSADDDDNDSESEEDSF